MALVDCSRPFHSIEAKVGFAFAGVKAVARKAIVRKDWANIAIEKNGRICALNGQSLHAPEHNSRGPKPQ